MSVDRYDRTLPLVVTYIKMYTAAFALLTATLGLVLKSYIAVEAGFKTATALLALAFIEYMIYTDKQDLASAILIISVTIVAFYSIQVEGNVGLATYMILSIVLSTTIRKEEKIISNVMLPNLVLYYVSTSFLLVTRNHITTLEIAAIATTLLLFIAKKPCIRVECLFKFKAYKTCRSIADTVTAKIGTIFGRLALQLYIEKQKAGTFLGKLLGIATKTLHILVDTGKLFNIVDQKAKEFMFTIPRKFLVIEKGLEDLFSRVSSATERLQQSMEHSLLFLMLLMSILVLISVIFYIVILYS